MNSLGDALKSAYDSDERQARGLDRGPHRTVVAIRRRRTARAAGTGTAAAVAIGALGAVWWLGPGGRVATPAVPMPSGTCAANLYLPPNPAALGDAPVLFRYYVDLRPDSFTHGVVAVTLDGVATRVEPDANGDYVFEGYTITSEEVSDEIKLRPVVGDATASGGAGSNWDGVSPYLWDYHWTTVVPDEVPAGIDTASLSATLWTSFSMGGSGFDAAATPAGTVTDEVITTTAGTTSQRLTYGDFLSGLQQTDGLISVALVVSGLPDGGTFTITSTYGQPDPALTACVVPWSTPSASPDPTGAPTATPSPDPGVSEGPEPGSEPLSGPESAVFACGIPLPADLKSDLGLDVSWESGLWPAAAAASQQFDFGAGGVLARGALPDGGPPHGENDANHWASSWTENYSLSVFDAVVAVKDGVVVGTVADSHGPTPTESLHFAGKGLDGTEWIDMFIGDVDARMVACPQFAVGDLEGAQAVLLLGTGAVGGPYQFAWTPIAHP